MNRSAASVCCHFKAKIGKLCRSCLQGDHFEVDFKSGSFGYRPKTRTLGPSFGISCFPINEQRIASSEETPKEVCAPSSKYRTWFGPRPTLTVAVFLALVLPMASTIIEVNFYVRNIWAFYFYIVVICLFITLIREKHGGEVHTLWFVFVLTTGFGFAIYYYLNISGSIVISENGIHVVERSSVEGGFFGFLEKLLKWWLQSSINVEEELTILLYVVVAVILPQSLSYVISGIFGCARPPILVAKVTKGAFYAVIKCYCVLAALVTSEKLFLLYMNSVFSVWDLQRPLLLLSVTFFLAFLYHSAHTIAHTSFKYINELKPPADCGVGLPFRERMSQYLGVVPDKLDSGRLAVAWLAKFVTDDVRKFMTKFTSQSDESQRTRGQAVASVVAAALQESTVRDEIGRLVSEEVHRRWAQ